MYSSKNFKKWKFGTINIRSGKERDLGAKLYCIAKEVSKAGLTFCCLQEVKYLNNDKKIITLDTGEKFEFHWCGRKKRREAGVGILIKVDAQIEVSDPDIQDPRVMTMNLKIYGFNLRIVNVYSPTEVGGTANEKDNFYRMINKACKRTEKHQKLIVIGDFNAETSLASRKCNFDGTIVIQDEKFNENGSRMKKFCRANKLGIASSFFEYTPEQRFTWYSCDKITRKVNDYVLPESYIQQYISDCIAYPALDFDSDHRILITHMNTPMTRRARWKPKLKKVPKSTPDLKSLGCEDVQKRFQAEISSYIQSTVKINSESANCASSRIVDNLKKAGDLTIPKVQKTKTAHEIWKEDIEINQILASRKGIQIKSTEYRNLTKKLKKRVNHLRNEKLAKEAEEIDKFATQRDIVNLFKSMKSGTDTFGKIKRNNKCDPNKLKAYFEKHFNPVADKDEPPELTEAPEFVLQLQNIELRKISSEPPSKEELLSTIKGLKTGKSANDIPTIYIKCAMSCNLFLEEMLDLYRTIWKTNQIPVNWGHSKLVALWKGSGKGSIDDPEAYRALQIGSSLCKILVVIIIKRLNTWYDKQLLDQQQGFRAGRGTNDGIFRLKRIQQITSKTKTQVYALFIDLSAAFDHINRKWLFKTIRQRFSDEQETKLIDLLESLYDCTTTSLAETPDDTFKTISGVRQGGPESPILYNLYMDYVMRVFMDNCSKKEISFLKLKHLIPRIASKSERDLSGSYVIDWIGYADDLILAFTSKSSLQNALTELNDTFSRFGLKINTSKTKTMVLNQQHTDKTYPKTVSHIDGVLRENVEVFRYLGAQIKYDEPTTGDAELELRVDSAVAKFYELGMKLMNYKIGLRTRVKILNSLVRSRLTYSCQCWSLTEKQKQKLTSTYNGFLRRMVKGGYRRKKDSWSFILTNNEILKMCNTEEIAKFIQKQQRTFVARAIRMENTSGTKKLLFNNNPSRVPGRSITLYSSVMKSEGITNETLIQRSIDHKY